MAANLGSVSGNESAVIENTAEATFGDPGSDATQTVASNSVEVALDQSTPQPQSSASPGDPGSSGSVEDVNYFVGATGNTQTSDQQQPATPLALDTTNEIQITDSFNKFQAPLDAVKPVAATNPETEAPGSIALPSASFNASSPGQGSSMTSANVRTPDASNTPTPTPTPTPTATATAALSTSATAVGALTASLPPITATALAAPIVQPASTAIAAAVPTHSAQDSAPTTATAPLPQNLGQGTGVFSDIATTQPASAFVAATASNNTAATPPLIDSANAKAQLPAAGEIKSLIAESGLGVATALPAPVGPAVAALAPMLGEAQVRPTQSTPQQSPAVLANPVATTDVATPQNPTLTGSTLNEIQLSAKPNAEANAATVNALAAAVAPSAPFAGAAGTAAVLAVNAAAQGRTMPSTGVAPKNTLTDAKAQAAVAIGAIPGKDVQATSTQELSAVAVGTRPLQQGLATPPLPQQPALQPAQQPSATPALPADVAGGTPKGVIGSGTAVSQAKPTELSAQDIATAVANGAKPSDFANLTGKEGLAAINAGVDPTQLGAAIVTNASKGAVNADGSLKVSLDGRPAADMKDPNLQSSLEIKGNLLMGVGIRKPEVGINWGYAMMDVSQGAGVVGKMLTGQKLGASDEVTMRSQFELDSANIPGIAQLASNPIMQKILGKNLDQADAGIVGKLTFGFKDANGASVPYLKKLEGFAYADLPSVGGMVNVDPTSKKVTAGKDGNQGLTNLTAGVQWTNDGSPLGKWEMTGDATNGKISSYFRPENAQQYNTPYASGWAFLGINSQGQERLATPLAQRVIDAARQSGGGNPAVEKITKLLDRTADVAQVGQFIQNIGKSLDKNEKSGRTDVGVGIVQAVIGAPPLPPGAGVAFRAQGQVIATQDGKDDITLKIGNNVVAQTTATALRKKGEEFSNAVTRALVGESESSAPTSQPITPAAVPKTPADNTNGGSSESAGRVYDMQVHAGTDPFALVNKDGKNHGNAPVAIATAVTQTLKEYGAVGTPKNATDASRMITETALALRDKGRIAESDAMLRKIAQTTGKYGVNFGNAVLTIENSKYVGPKPNQEAVTDVQKVFRGDFKSKQQILRA
jgi:hypothetical protein